MLEKLALSVSIQLSGIPLPQLLDLPQLLLEAAEVLLAAGRI